METQTENRKFRLIARCTDRPLIVVEQLFFREPRQAVSSNG